MMPAATRDWPVRYFNVAHATGFVLVFAGMLSEATRLRPRPLDAFNQPFSVTFAWDAVIHSVFWPPSRRHCGGSALSRLGDERSKILDCA